MATPNSLAGGELVGQPGLGAQMLHEPGLQPAVQQPHILDPAYIIRWAARAAAMVLRP